MSVNLCKIQLNMVTDAASSFSARSRTHAKCADVLIFNVIVVVSPHATESKQNPFVLKMCPKSISLLVCWPHQASPCLLQIAKACCTLLLCFNRFVLIVFLFAKYLQLFRDFDLDHFKYIQYIQMNYLRKKASEF